MKHIVWDWNGTLLDDTWLCYDIANAMMAERGMALLADEDAYREVFCFPIIDYYRRMGYVFGEGREPYEALSVQFVNSYEAKVHRCLLRAGAAELLRALKNSGRRQVLLSATRLGRLRPQVDNLKLTATFEQILGLTDDLAHSKVALAQEFLAREKVAPEDVIFIGDTDHDAAVAQACGCHCALLTGGHQGRATLEACAVPVFDTPRELAQYLGV